MAKCAYCEAETELYYSGTPICIECSEKLENKRKAPAPTPDIQSVLYEQVNAATARANAATEAFSATISDIPSGHPHPDGKQRIHNASNELTFARKDLLRAHSRLTDYLTHGFVPEDLKRHG